MSKTMELRWKLHWTWIELGIHHAWEAGCWDLPNDLPPWPQWSQMDGVFFSPQQIDVELLMYSNVYSKSILGNYLRFMLIYHVLFFSGEFGMVNAFLPSLLWIHM